MRILILVIFLFVSNCKFSQVVDSHGYHFLEKKEKKLLLNSSNKNDVVSLLGPPSTKSSFDNNLWIYIERKKTRSATKLGRKSSYVNNVLLLEIDNRGLLVYKKLYNIDDMQDINFIKDETEISYSKKSFVYDFLSSMRQKVNDPLGVRAKKRKKIKNQQ
tara:strand:- start:1054 stop:1533 length:480 start_codon:yes stop_codon:yes gene_type:complete